MNTVTKRQKIKLSLTLLMSLLAIVLFIVKPTSTKLICVFAMLFSSLGDIALMDLKLLTKHLKKDLLTVGMLFFGIAHVLYIVLYMLKASYSETSVNIGTYISFAISMCTVGVLIIISVTRKNLPISLVFFGILYILILSINLCTVSTLAFSMGGAAYLTLIGAISFFVSDMIIAFNKLLNASGGEIPIWIFYVLGQVLLIYGA